MFQYRSYLLSNCVVDKNGVHEMHGKAGAPPNLSVFFFTIALPTCKANGAHCCIKRFAMQYIVYVINACKRSPAVFHENRAPWLFS